MSNYEPEYGCNMDETELYSRAHSKKNFNIRDGEGPEITKKRVRFAIVVYSIGTDKLKLLVIYASRQPPCFGRWQPHEYILLATQVI